MANVIQALAIPKGWSKAYISQLAGYVRERDRHGYFRGNEKLFEERHKAILKWIESYEEYIDDYDIKFERKEKDTK